jgi:molecular chaperone Hsp33
LANPTGVVAAGGILAQVLPGADERALIELEKRAVALPPVTQLIAEHADINALLHALAGDLALRAHRSIPVHFSCRCDLAKVEAALLGLGAEELHRLAREERQAEATCEYCKRRYVFSLPQIETLLARLA